MESSYGGAKRGIISKMVGPADRDKEMFMVTVQSMLLPYLEEALKKCMMEKSLVKIQIVHRELLEQFWTLTQTDSQVSMAMIPVMAYIKKANRKMDKT